MNRTSLFGIALCILVLFLVLSVPTIAESDTKLYVGITNGIPYVFRHVCVFGDIVNIGKNPVYNVSAVFSIIGGRNGEINVTFTTDTLPEMPPGTGWGFSNDADGFGPVTITLTVYASNIETITRSVKGFQIRDSTLIPFPVLRNTIFALVLRMYV
jgi:hypothetical protein